MSDLKRVSMALLMLIPLFIPIYITKDGVQPYSTRHLVALGAIALIALLNTILFSRLMRKERCLALGGVAKSPVPIEE